MLLLQDGPQWYYCYKFKPLHIPFSTVLIVVTGLYNNSITCFLSLQYFIFLMIIFAAQLAAGILAAIYGGEVTEYLAAEGKDFLATSFDNSDNASGVNKTISLAWDEFQKQVSLLV